MEIIYYFQCSASYYDEHDHEYFDEEEYVYEINDKELKQHLIEYFASEYNLSVQTAKHIIDDFDLMCEIQETYEEDECFYAIMKDYYYREAMAEYEERGEY